MSGLIGREAFCRAQDVSRETLERLDIYERLLRNWQARVNLVAPSTIDDLWERHFRDSAQLLCLSPPAARRWADLGSGAGFPGLVIALFAGDRQGFEVVLVEKLAKKCAFLREVIGATGARASVVQARIETISPLMADVVTARALAPLKELLPLVLRHRVEGGTILLPKGENADLELTATLRTWTLTFERFPSRTDPRSSIFRIDRAERKPHDD